MSPITLYLTFPFWKGSSRTFLELPIAQTKRSSSRKSLFPLAKEQREGGLNTRNLFWQNPLYSTQISIAEKLHLCPWGWGGLNGKEPPHPLTASGLNEAVWWRLGLTPALPPFHAGGVQKGAACIPLHCGEVTWGRSILLLTCCQQDLTENWASTFTETCALQLTEWLPIRIPESHNGIDKMSKI